MFLTASVFLCFTELIVIHSRKLASERERHMAIHTATLWGWLDPCLTQKKRSRIARAACTQIAYDFGYSAPLAHARLPAWYGSINAAISLGENDDPVSPSQCGSNTYVSQIELKHPGYIRELFRYANVTKGCLASFEDLADIMNLKSGAPGETRATLSISRRQLADWFRSQGGKEISPIEKPLLTDEHKRRRLQWAHANWTLLSNTNSNVCFLDEKWFYTTSRRNKLKVLPRNASEDDTAVQPIQRPHIRSRR